MPREPIPSKTLPSGLSPLLSQGLSLVVLSGLHEGVCHPMGGPALAIGGGGGADVVLADDGLAPIHVQLEAAGGFAILKALHAGVVLEGQGAGPLGAGQQRQIRLPATFTVAGVRLRCDGPPPPRRLTPGRVALLAAALLACFSALPGPAGPLGQPTPRAVARTMNPDGANPDPLTPDGTGPSPLATALVAPPAALVPAPAPALAPVRALRPPPMTAAAAAELLRADLAAAGLQGVTIQTQGAGILATGAIPPAAAPTWQAVRQTFDRRTAGRVRLDNTVTARTETPFNLTLDSVWTGNFPNIIVGGAKYLEGGVLPNGWTLDRIQPNRLSLHRGDARIEVAF